MIIFSRPEATMPIYEYRCAGCGHQQEFLQKLSDPPQTRCPQCGQEALEKMVTAAGFQLKGSGWYATDFKGGGQKPAAKAEGATSDAKSEAAKPAPACGTGACPACQ
jgi:putative FmdB family regulatory protein